jgi:hypothetical protein
MAKLTERQRQLLADMKTREACFLEGADVRVARSLAHLGYVTLDDNGHMARDRRGRSDGERWWCVFVAEPEDFIPPGTKVVIPHESGIPELEEVVTVTKCHMWPDHCYELVTDDGKREYSGLYRDMIRRLDEPRGARRGGGR